MIYGFRWITFPNELVYQKRDTNGGINKRIDVYKRQDLDEGCRPGWRQAAEAAWAPGVNQLRYRYTWNFNEDGSEGYVFYIEKIHARSGFRWVGAVHEVLRLSLIHI